MKIYNFKDLSKEKLNSLCSRSISDDNLVKLRTEEIIDNVKNNGDQALLSYAKQFDNIELSSLFIGKKELAELAEQIPAEVKTAIDTAYQNIYTFHASQLKPEEKIETMPGVTCWREVRGIERVGLYVPGGTAVLPSTFLMLGIPAKIAGCQEIVVCSPPQSDGKVNCYIAYVATLLNIDKIYLAGGAQAVAAMAYGTETIPQVYKIFGPGNRYVTEAKKLVQNRVAIDMPAGPSEVLVLADETANPSYVAADLLAQAEHGTDSQSILAITSNKTAALIIAEIEKQLAVLPRKTIAEQAIAQSRLIYFDSEQKALDFINEYAPEHFIIAAQNEDFYTNGIQNAGSVFVGSYTPESAGDYASGTNHTLPTNGYARNYGGVNLDSFLKAITFQKISPKGLQTIGNTIEIMAEAEGLQAHKNAVTIRLKTLENENI